jgi:integrase/recombinase XerD
MELAALKLGDVFDEDGSVKSQFQLAQRNTKGGNARTVFVNTKLRKALKDYGEQSDLTQPERALFPSQKGGTLFCQHHVSAVLRHLQSLWL